MPRLFVGIDLPPELDDRLELMCGGIPGARWEHRDKFHVTLRFLGDVDGRLAREATHALESVAAPEFPLTLAGAGVFPPRGQPRVVWIGVEEVDSLGALKVRIDRALAPLGLEPDRRKFHAHVTLARLRRSPPRRVAEFITEHSLFRAPTFMVRAFRLYSSVLSPKGSKYRVEASYPLDDANSPQTGHDRSDG